jgi:perosamine synthetase
MDKKGSSATIGDARPAVIPLERPTIGEEEIEAAVAVLRSGELWQFSSPVIAEFEQAFADYIGVKHAVAVNSCGSALEIALAAAGLGPGDEVITTPWTFIATNMGIVTANCIPVFADIDPRTWNLHARSIEEKITRRTKAILLVHVFGHPCDMDAVMTLAGKHNLVVIEDCAQSLGSTWGGQQVGSIGQMGCFSFCQPKTMTTGGEGGMLTTNDDELAKQARLIRSYGYDRIIGIGPARYEHTVLGSNYRITAMQAAIGLVQLKKLPAFLEKRAAIARRYSESLSRLPGITPPYVAPQAGHSFYGYVIKVDDSKAGISRSTLHDRLITDGIECGIWYSTPNHLQPVFRSLSGHGRTTCPFTCPLYSKPVDYRDVHLPVAEGSTQVVLSLPVYPLLAVQEQERVIAAMQRHVVGQKA